jgi:5-methylcytosine-specific restriction enzyme A
VADLGAACVARVGPRSSLAFRTMPLLYYWRPDNYARDERFGFGFHLNQNSPAMEAAGPGESLWAFTRLPRDSRYVLAAELVIRAVTRNPPNYRYGAWRIWGDLDRSRYFDAKACPRVDALIRSLGVKASASRLGQSFQGHAAVRRLDEAAHQVLAEHARELPVLAHAAIYPEDEFEARLVHEESVRQLIVREADAEHDLRLRYLYETVNVQRARRHVRQLQETYGGRCQLCLYDPEATYGHRTCHGHHIQWLSRGGDDELENMVLVCPNHHAAIHRDDAVFDYADLTFAFSNGLQETLVTNEHLPAA